MPERPPILAGTWNPERYRKGAHGIKDTMAVQPSKEMSTTVKSTELRVWNTDHVMTIPVMVATTVWDIKLDLSQKLDIDPSGTMKFVTKQGCYWREQNDHEEIARKVWVKGISSFERERVKHQHPLAIIGAGHIGLRQAMILIKHKVSDFVVFDRKPAVGGMAWWDQANKSSKLQTERGVYHMQYDEDLDPPTNDYPWPSRDDLLEHFQWAADHFGITPYIRLSTDVKTLTTIPSKTSKKYDTTYDLILEKAGDNVLDEEKFTASAVYLFPGNLSVARREEYKGEEDFGGVIAYGMFNTLDYNEITGKNVAIIGHGAFAVENVRTCLEYDAGLQYLVCRRKNISCPRFVSWLANMSITPVQATTFLDAMKPMYDLAGFDVWSYYAVNANASRTNCSIQQKVRFGIGDVYFLAISWGKLEVIVEPSDCPVKRVSQGVVHVASGRKLEVGAILKLLGFVGNCDNDRLMGVKEMHGFWANGDPKRYVCAEPISVMASNFGSTSFSPGAIGWSYMGLALWWYPQDLYKVVETGMLPKHKSEGEDRPAYVVDARHGTQAGIIVGSMLPLCAPRGPIDAWIKHNRMTLLHPIDKFLDYCREDWNRYTDKLTAQGFTGPEYPYTKEVAHAIHDRYWAEHAKAMEKHQAAS